MTELKQLIDTKFESLAAFCKAAGISRTACNTLLNGGNAKAETIIKASRALDLNAAEIDRLFFAGARS